MATGNPRKVGGQWQAFQSDGQAVNFDITQNGESITPPGREMAVCKETNLSSRSSGIIVKVLANILASSILWGA
jgi:hypothetical protein